MCKYSKVLKELSKGIKNNYDYWKFTEVFCVLHDGKDYCGEHCKKDKKKIKIKKESSFPVPIKSSHRQFYCPDCGRSVYSCRC